MLFDYNGDAGMLIDATKSPVINVKRTFENLHTSHDTWDSISIPQLKRTMRSTYNNMRDKNFMAKISSSSEEVMKKYSYEYIGNKMKGLINE